MKDLINSFLWTGSRIKNRRTLLGILYSADLARKRERQLTAARADLTTGLTNSRAANWVLKVAFSPFRALSRRQLTFPVLLGNQPCQKMHEAMMQRIQLASVVQRLDSAIRWVNLYPVDSAISFSITYPLDSDLSGG